MREDFDASDLGDHQALLFSIQRAAYEDLGKVRLSEHPFPRKRV
jgi:hypothetical protein